MRLPIRLAGLGLAAAALVAPATLPAQQPVSGAAAASALAAVPGPAAVTAHAAASAAAAALSASTSWTPSRIVLVPTKSPRTSQRVLWSMPRRLGRQKVEYRIPGHRSAFVPASRRPATTTWSSGTTRPRYAATMTSLKPGTRYAYRIVTPKGRTSWYHFRTAGGTTATLIGLGDGQVDNRGVPRTTVRMAMADEPGALAVLNAGDVVNAPYRDSEWSALFSAIGSSGRSRNWVVAIGNHEQCVLLSNCRSGNAQAFRSYFDFPTNGFPDQGPTWYRVDLPSVRVVVLDSFGGRMEDQAAFLEQSLATSTRPWSIVLMHAPAFASRPGRTNADVRRLWLPIIEAHKVDLVLSGHDHAYARGYLHQDGPVYVNSVSGPKFYAVSDADWVANGATRVRWASRTATYQVIKVTRTSLSYRAVVSHKGSGASTSVPVGHTLDRFTLTR